MLQQYFTISLYGSSVCAYLICGVVVLLQVRMSQGLLHADALDGIKGQHAAQQVQSCVRIISSVSDMKYISFILLSKCLFV